MDIKYPIEFDQLDRPMNVAEIQCAEPAQTASSERMDARKITR
jgi:hypothetical protein